MGVYHRGTGYIYAVLYSDGHVKIGVSQNMKRRVKALDGYSPYELLRVTAFEITGALIRAEKLIQEIFKDKWVRKEFYYFDWEDWLIWFRFWEQEGFAIEQDVLDDLYQFYAQPNYCVETESGGAQFDHQENEPATEIENSK